MQLLIQRSQDQTMFLNRPVFKLWAKFECTQEENALINKYQVSEYLLSEGRPGEIKRAAILAVFWTILVSILLVLVLAITHRLGLTPTPPEILGSGIGAGILIYLICWYLVYHQIREQIKISDILSGRSFKCRSVLALIIQEHDLAELGDCFRQMLEAMKTWGGREVIELRPFVAPTLQIRKPS